MTSAELTTYVTFGYLACGVFWLVIQVAAPQAPRARRAAFCFLVLVWAVHTASIGLRWVESYQMGIGHAPLSNLYESLIFFAWCMGLALMLVRLRYKTDTVVLLGLPVVFLVMASTFLMDHTIKPLIPALQSNWLIAHVITCFLGYAGFAVSFVAAVMLLASRGGPSSEKRKARRGILDEIVYKAIMIGFPMLTVGIITGAAWADYAWGSYWSWDPKETWSLVTWMVYAAFLHARLARGWSGQRSAYLSLLGFAAVLFTYFVVSYLPGLHSYF